MRRKITIKTSSVGLALMGIYIFLSFNAMNIWLPSVLNSISLVSLLGFGVIAFILNSGDGKIRIPVYTLWYIVFMSLSLAMMLYSQEKDILSGEFYLMIVSLILTFFFQLFVDSEETFKKMCWMYSVSSFVLVLTLIVTGNMVADAANRLGEDLMGNANLFAGMIMVSVMYKLWLLVYDQNKISTRILLILMTVVDYYALILSAGRKFFVIPFIFLYVLLWFKKDKKGRKHIVKYTVIIAALALLAVVLIMKVPVFYKTIGYRMESLVLGMLGLAEHGNSAAIREVMRNEALARWLESPVWGYGFDSFKYHFWTVAGYFVYSHCNYAELLYNGGLIYAITYYWFFGYVLWNVFKKKIGLSRFRAFSVAAVISFLVFDYGAVTYSIAIFQIMLAMSLRVLGFEEEDCSELMEK